MAIPKYYLKKGVTDYELAGFSFEREGNESIDQTPFEVSKANGANIEIGDDITIGYYEGVVWVPSFSGDVVEKSIHETAKYVLESYGGRLSRSDHISKIYNDQSPEAIAEDIIDTYVPTLTYASTATSGVTIKRFIVKNESPAEVMERLVKLTNWQLRTDNSKNFYFEPIGTTTNAGTLTIGTNSHLNNYWNYVPGSIINTLTYIGGNATFSTTESFTATASQTDFIVVQKIAGSVRITDDGTEVVGGVSGQTTGYDYTIDSDNKTIVFEVGRTNAHTIIITYNYEVPILINAKNDESISSYGIHSRKITENYVTTMDDARKRVKQILATYSTLSKNTTIIVPYSSDYSPGETVNVIDSFNGIDESLVITKTHLTYPGGMKKIDIGTPSLTQYSWQKDIDSRLRALEQSQDNSDRIQYYKGFKGSVNVKVTLKKVTVRTHTLGHSWIVGSSTNGIVGTNTNTEDGEQQVVGSAGRVETIVSTIP